MGHEGGQEIGLKRLNVALGELADILKPLDSTFRARKIMTARGSQSACDRWRFLRLPKTTSATKRALAVELLLDAVVPDYCPDRRARCRHGGAK
jgi:hypothetical protein